VVGQFGKPAGLRPRQITPPTSPIGPLVCTSSTRQVRRVDAQRPLRHANQEIIMALRRMFATTAGAGQSKPGKFQHVDPQNAPRHDLRKPKHLPDPDLTRDIGKNDLDLRMDDPDLTRAYRLRRCRPRG